VHDIVILNLAVAAVWISDNWQRMSTPLARQAIIAVFTAANSTASCKNRKMEQSSYLARFLAFCTSKFTAFLEADDGYNILFPFSEEENPLGGELGTLSDLSSSHQKDIAPLSPHEHAYMQPEAHRYIEETLTAPYFQLGTDSVLDTNSLLSFFQDAV
jgi:hypothetical protein